MIRAVAARRRSHSERGASLVIALAMILIVSVAIVAVLAYAATSLHTISVIKNQRQVLYTADGAVQTAMQSVRTDPTIGTGPSCPTLSYSSMGKNASVGCTVVQARGPGSPGVDFPPYAIWAVGPSNAETGISDDKSGTLTIGGPIASNEGAGAVPGIDTQNMDVTGYTVDSRGPCTGTIKVADPSDLRCNTGINYPDPSYPSQALPGLSSPNPAPTCGVSRSTLTFHPGYYTNVTLFNSPTYGSCQSGVLYFEPGVYYFDFGFDPAFPGTTWDMNITIVGGEYKGWDPTQANSVPPAPGGGASKACKTELDGANSGVQFVFGGVSQVDANSNSSQIELCASPKPIGTKQQIVVYGQTTGAGPTPQTTTSEATSTNPPTPNPPGTWTGLTPVNNLLPIAPNPSAIDGQVATYALPTTNPGSSVAMQFKGLPGITVPGGSINVAYALKFNHLEVAGNTNQIQSLQLQIGSCVINVPKRLGSNPTATFPEVFTQVTNPCLPAAVASTFDATYTATAANGKTFTESIDGIELTATWTPPAVRMQSGCVAAIAGCHFLDLAKNQAVFVAWGTVYAPLGSIYNDFKNKSGYEFRRGVIARTVNNVAVPPSDSQSSFCLGYGNPCIGPSRILRFTATVNGATTLVALVQYFDAPTIGRSVSILSWNEVRS
jgi:hypothetical protein